MRRATSVCHVPNLKPDQRHGSPPAAVCVGIPTVCRICYPGTRVPGTGCWTERIGFARGD
eukprot:117159-Rhodomonas_salina.1